MKVKPVIMAGGAGTRLWPLSRQLYPKQFVQIFDNISLLQKTVLRNKIFGKPTVITSLDYSFITLEQMHKIEIDADIIVEPLPKDTAPCAIVASLNALKHGYNAVILIPSDHYIANEANYIADINKAINYIDKSNMCVIGIKPETSHTGYGYIKTKNLLEDSVFAVEKFVEKPDLNTALAYYAMNNLGHNNYFWNSGIFIYKADTMLKHVKQYHPKLLFHVLNAFKNANDEHQFVQLAADDYTKISAISIDKAIAEHMQQMILLQANFAWSDLGDWNPLWHTRNKDENNNYFEGDVITRRVTNSYVSADNKLTAVIGLDNVIVINTKDAVLVADKSKSDEIKQLVAYLNSMGRKEAIKHADQPQRDAKKTQHS